MQKTTILTVLLVVLMLGACNSSSTKSEKSNSADSTTTQSDTKQIFSLDTTKLKRGETFYQCEMHPEVISDKAGNCSKCGMELSEMKKN